MYGILQHLVRSNHHDVINPNCLQIVDDAYPWPPKFVLHPQLRPQLVSLVIYC